jgi:hypothetical protein
MITKLDTKYWLDWPNDPNYQLLGILMVVLYPWGLIELFLRSRRKKQREAIKDYTKSVLMDTVKYLGGHPLVPVSQRVVISLTNNKFNIYFYGYYSYLTSFVSIPLLDIEDFSIGQPKSVHAIYDENRGGYTTDVVAGFPYLNIKFRLSGQCYTMTFTFERFNPIKDVQNWHNQIVYLQYRLRLSTP